MRGHLCCIYCSDQCWYRGDRGDITQGCQYQGPVPSGAIFEAGCHRWPPCSSKCPQTFSSWLQLSVQEDIFILSEWRLRDRQGMGVSEAGPGWGLQVSEKPWVSFCLLTRVQAGPGTVLAPGKLSSQLHFPAPLPLPAARALPLSD